MNRRHFTLAAAATVLVRPAVADADALRAAIAAYTAATPRNGRVVLEIAPLVDNGNVVPVAIQVDSPMTAADHVKTIALFTERNPSPEVAVFHLGPRAGRAQVATRMRLATSQQIVALATMNDGSVWRAAADVVVTLAACIEG